MSGVSWTALKDRFQNCPRHARQPSPGGPRNATPGRDAAGKTPVASPIETHAQRGLGGARLPAVSNVSTVPPRSVITQAIAPGTTDRRQPDPASKLIVDGTPIPCLPGRTTPSATRESARPPGTTRPVTCTLAGHLARLPAALPGRTHDTTASGPPTSPSRPRERRADLRHVGGKGWAELGMITSCANPPSRPSVPTTSPGASPNHAARQRFYLIPTRIQFHYTTCIPRCQWDIAYGDVCLLSQSRLRHRRRRHG